MPSIDSFIVHERGTGKPVTVGKIVWWDWAGMSDMRPIRDGNGFVNFAHTERPHLEVAVECPGYEDLNLSIEGTEDVRVVEVSPLARPFDVQEHGFIRAQGTGFVTEDGAPWLFAGYSVHCLLPVAIRDEAQAHRVFEAMDRYGANIIWLFGTHLSQWKIDHGYHHDPRHPDHPAQLARLFDLGAEHRKRFCYGLFADAQSIPVSEQQALWARDATVVKGRWNVNVYAIGNEAGANGYDPADFGRVDVGAAMLSKGDLGAGPHDQPPRPYWDVNMWEGRCTYHGVPDHKVLDDSGTGIRELQAGYTRDDGVIIPRIDGPLLMMETDIYNDDAHDWNGDNRNTRPSFALAQGVNIAANCAGGCFGSSASLEAKDNGPVADQCAREWFRGMWRGFVR